MVARYPIDFQCKSRFGRLGSLLPGTRVPVRSARSQAPKAWARAATARQR
jgi:hypothetical protein